MLKPEKKMLDSDFKHEIPEDLAVYIIVDVDTYENFMNDMKATHIKGIKEVFLKEDANGELYATGENFFLEEKDFDLYVWAKKCEYN